MKYSLVLIPALAAFTLATPLNFYSGPEARHVFEMPRELQHTASGHPRFLHHHHTPTGGMPMPTGTGVHHHPHHHRPKGGMNIGPDLNPLGKEHGLFPFDESVEDAAGPSLKAQHHHHRPTGTKSMPTGGIHHHEPHRHHHHPSGAGGMPMPTGGRPKDLGIPKFAHRIHPTPTPVM